MTNRLGRNKRRKPDETLIYMPPQFPQILQSNGGIFPASTEAEIMQAWCAWYCCLVAHKTLQEIPAQVTMEGDVDTTVNLRQIIDGVLLMYGCEIESTMNLMPLCRRWTFMSGLVWSDRFQAWLDSGGRAYDEVTREPDAI